MKGYSRSKSDFRELLYSKYINMNDIEIQNGCLWLWDKPTDYVLLSWDLKNLPKLFKKDNIRFEYNQDAQTRSKKSCTIFSAVGGVSDLVNKEFDLWEIREIDEESYNRGRVKNEGRYVQNAVKLVKDRCNSNKKFVSEYGKLAYYYVWKYDDETVEWVIDMLYNICTGFYGNSLFVSDYRKDSILNGTDFGASTFWHAVNVIKDGVRKVKDNYKGRKTYDGKKDNNYYELQHKISEIKNFHTWGYVFTLVSEDNYERINELNQAKSKILQVIPLNSEIRHFLNDTTYKNLLHTMNDANRKKLEDIERELAKLR